MTWLKYPKTKTLVYILRTALFVNLVVLLKFIEVGVKSTICKQV